MVFSSAEQRPYFKRGGTISWATAGGCVKGKEEPLTTLTRQTRGDYSGFGVIVCDGVAGRRIGVMIMPCVFFV